MYTPVCVCLLSVSTRVVCYLPQAVLLSSFGSFFLPSFSLSLCVFPDSPSFLSFTSIASAADPSVAYTPVGIAYDAPSATVFMLGKQFGSSAAAYGLYPTTYELAVCVCVPELVCVYLCPRIFVR